MISLHPRELSATARLKFAASMLLAVPASVLLVFAIGEIVGGDLSGAQHIPEAALLPSDSQRRSSTS